MLSIIIIPDIFDLRWLLVISLTVVWLSYIVIHTTIRTTTTPSQYKTHFLCGMNYHNMDDDELQRSNEWILGCGIVVMGLVLIVTGGVISVAIYGKFISVYETLT